ncbi:ABC transporter ATP-binding protein [Agromyces lapidis]|uniref:ABC transporter ATP-binding protein n=1 Tax=Agromyces lapidis TaxID=279574 RepID=A0ABV5SPT1_9MICO|nr:ABC transporter ATP-binding protein [Agromyces lapidis]
MPTSSVSSPAAIEARGWGWRHASRLRPAIEHLDLRIHAGERVLLLGPSGAGKSTLLHALAGVHGGDDEGEEYGELAVDGVAPSAARGRAGLVLQDPDSQVILARVGDDVAFGCENLGVPRDEIWHRVRAALAEVGLGLPLDHPSSALSGGQKQRLALAGAIAMRPGLLLLDEPTANLDPDGVREVRDAVGRVLDRTRATLVVVEHRVDVWLDLVDRVVVLGHDGRLLADGAPREVLAEQRQVLLDAGVWVPGVPVPGSAAADAVGRASEVGAAGSADRISLEPALTTRGLAIGRRANAVVQRGLDLGIAAGASTVVTGPNGVGKSTLALTLGGLLRPLEGHVEASRVLAAGLRREPIAWRSRELLTRIGTVFQEPEHQFVASTVAGELSVGLRALRLEEPAITARVDELLQRLRLDHLARANPFTLSGGEKRRLSVAAVLATRPSVLILDEPTFGQDRLTWIELTALLRGLVDDGLALVSVTHDAAFIAELGDERIALAPSTSREFA